MSALITDAIARFSEQYAEVHLEVMFLKQDELIEAVRERKVDFALTFEMMEKDDLLTEQPVKTYHLCAIVSDQTPLALSQRHVYPQGHAEVYGTYIELTVLILVRA